MRTYFECIIRVMNEVGNTLEGFDISDATLEGVVLFGPPCTVVEVPQDSCEADIFSLLKWRFKAPNGPFSMALGPQGDPDAPYKWDYIFATPDRLTIHFVRSVRNMEIWIRGHQVSQGVVLRFLDRNLRQYKAEISRMRDSLESYTLILNPYVRHKSIAELAHEELTEECPQRPVAPISSHAKKEEVEQYLQEFRAYHKASEREALYSMMLVTESAYMVEAYLNLVLALFMKDAVRNNKSMFDETLRRRWESKLQRLPLDCDYVCCYPDMKSPIVAHVRELFRMRNRIAHSYPDKHSLAVGKMWFCERYPVLHDPLPYDSFQIAINNRLPSRNEAFGMKKVADMFISFVDALIEKEYRGLFRFAAKSNPLGYNEAKKIFSIPFGDAVVLGTWGGIAEDA